MKHFYLKSLVLLLMLMCMVKSHASAPYLLKNGIYYDLNMEEKTAKVVACQDGKYSGDIIIPDEVVNGPGDTGPENFIYRVTNIGSNAFDGCTSLTSVTIGNNVTSIGRCAFYGCTGLTTVTIPNSVTSIGEAAFYGCTGLTSITIPNSVTKIWGGAFYGCTGLTSVEYSSFNHLCSIYFEKVTSNPLYYARHLFINGEEVKDNLVIPETIDTIGQYALNGCLLKNVRLKHQTPPVVGTETFSNPTLYHATLYVPANTWASYAYDNGWYPFINIRETAMEENQLTSRQSYTVMDAQTFSYLIYDPVNNGVGTISSVGIDENNPNHSWQTFVVEGERYLYNIGARKFAVPSADGKGLVLTDNVVSLPMTDGTDGLLFGNQSERQWALVVNEKMLADNSVEETVVTSISSMRADTDHPTSIGYGADGRRQKISQRGLNIIRRADGRMVKVLK